MLTVRPARLTEIQVVSQLWDEAAAWLAGRGIDQWQYPARTDAIARNIAAGDECWLAELGERVVATITLDHHADPEFWLPEDNPEDGLYAHRMVVVRDVGGQEIGSALLDWASLRTAAIGRHWLRLDAWRTNPELLRYYEARGFDLVRVVNLPHRRSGALYQRPAGKVLGLGPDVREVSADAT